jgi:ankyrin repeat protein
LLDVQDEQGYMALMYAVENEREDTIHLLLGYEPDYLLVNKDGNAAGDLVSNENIKHILFTHEMNSWPLFTLPHLW